MPSLGVNIDHVATLRQARYRLDPDSPHAEPDPLAAAHAAESAGASGITAHLRLDRRHVLDSDILRLRASVKTKLNLEMGNTQEILKFALLVKPEDVCLVPENRQEVTTEGGLDCVGQLSLLRATVETLKSANIRVSMFIDPTTKQIEASAELGASVVELHTGAFAISHGANQQAELQKLIAAAEHAHRLGLIVNAGHGINYANIGLIRQIPHLDELNIGHSIISRAIFTGMEAAVRDMIQLLK